MGGLNWPDWCAWTVLSRLCPWVDPFMESPITQAACRLCRELGTGGREPLIQEGQGLVNIATGSIAFRTSAAHGSGQSCRWHSPEEPPVLCSLAASPCQPGLDTWALWLTWLRRPPVPELWSSQSFADPSKPSSQPAKLLILSKVQGNRNTWSSNNLKQNHIKRG